eukprot:TRINITY_DN1327_c0_g1_i9.p1 TRINITY_DN1327_c0_g1~~TRINITY_DN1327_c0_g1_i9.p1  ORF type:complete len:392 (+),score=65.30 TRINITY_DN1327_c0_g1_i9:3-1178(+)
MSEDDDHRDRRSREYSREPGENKAFIGGLDWNTTSEGLRNYFSKYGEVMDAIVMRDRFTNHSRGFGFVVFRHASALDKVCSELHEIDGRGQIEAKRAVARDEMRRADPPRSREPEPTAPSAAPHTPAHHRSSSQRLQVQKIFVTGLPIELTEDEFKKYFSAYGRVIETQIILHHDTGKSRGFGFITFDQPSGVDAVMQQREHVINGRQLEIRLAEPRHKGPPQTPSGYDRAPSSAGYDPGYSGQGGMMPSLGNPGLLSPQSGANAAAAAALPFNAAALVAALAQQYYAALTGGQSLPALPASAFQNSAQAYTGFEERDQRRHSQYDPYIQSGPSVPPPPQYPPPRQYPSQYGQDYPGNTGPSGYGPPGGSSGGPSYSRSSSRHDRYHPYQK